MLIGGRVLSLRQSFKPSVVLPIPRGTEGLCAFSFLGARELVDPMAVVKIRPWILLDPFRMIRAWKSYQDQVLPSISMGMRA